MPYTGAMVGYGQFCPIAKAAEIVTERWIPLVLRELLSGSHRFNDLRRGVPLMSPSLLVQRLRALERAGVVERRPRTDGGSEYHLTLAGEELRPLLQLLDRWGRRWVRGQFTRRELDAGVLMWDVHRNVLTDRLPAERIVVFFDLQGAGPGKRYWWLVLERSGVDLCLNDPGFGVDLELRASVRAMVRVWLRQLAFDQAVRSGAVEISGRTILRKQFASWLGLAPAPARSGPGGDHAAT